MKSVIYLHPKIYEIVMRMLYGRNFKHRFKAIYELIPLGTNVVEVCMGDCYLYRNYLRKKSISYLGLDINETFVKYAHKKGVQARKHNLITEEVPEADYIIIQASLYQFIPNEDEIMKKLLNASMKKLIVAEPVFNVSSSKNPVIAFVAKRFANPGTKHVTKRFDRESLMELFKKYEQFLETVFEIKGGREVIGVFNTELS